MYLNSDISLVIGQKLKVWNSVFVKDDVSEDIRKQIELLESQEP